MTCLIKSSKSYISLLLSCDIFPRNIHMEGTYMYTCIRKQTNKKTLSSPAFWNGSTSTEMTHWGGRSQPLTTQQETLKSESKTDAQHTTIILICLLNIQQIFGKRLLYY